MSKNSVTDDNGVEFGIETSDGVVSGDERDRDVAVTELFSWIYRFFYSKTVGLILILIFAFLAVVGSLIVQAPPDVYADPVSAESFLDSMRESYGGWTPILSALGFFRVWTSPIFYIVVAMLAASIIACTTHRIPELWRRVHAPRVHVRRTFFAKARYRGKVATELPADEALTAATAVLKQNRFRVLVDEKDPTRARYADRFAWSGIGTVIAHASFVLILLAFVISNTWGIDEDLPVPVGTTVEVGYETGLSVHAASFRDTYTDEGRPSDYVSVLLVFDGDALVAEQEVRVNEPLVYEGVRFHQSSFGIATDVTVTDAADAVVFEGSVPMRWTSSEGANAVGLFDIPGTEYEVVVVTAASGRPDSTIPPGAALFEFYRQDDPGAPIGVSQATQGSSTTIEEYTFAFDRERQYTGIRLRQDPGAIVMWVGSTLLVVGMCITFMLPYRRLWLRVEETDGEREILFGAVSRYDASYQRLFEKVIVEVDQQLTDIKEEVHG